MRWRRVGWRRRNRAGRLWNWRSRDKRCKSKQTQNRLVNTDSTATQDGLFAFEDLDFTCRNNHGGWSGGHDVRRVWRQRHHVDARSRNHRRHRSEDLAWREANHRSHRWSRENRYGREERGAYRRWQLFGKQKQKQVWGLIMQPVGGKKEFE